MKKSLILIVLFVFFFENLFAQTIDCEEAKLDFFEYLKTDKLFFHRDEEKRFCDTLKLNELGRCFLAANDSVRVNYQLPDSLIKKYPGAIVVAYCCTNQTQKLFIALKSPPTGRNQKDVENIIFEYFLKKYIRRLDFKKAENAAISGNLPDDDSIASYGIKNYPIKLAFLDTTVSKYIQFVYNTSPYKSDSSDKIAPILYYPHEDSTLDKKDPNYHLADEYARFLFFNIPDKIEEIAQYHPRYIIGWYKWAIDHFRLEARNIETFRALLNIDVSSYIKNDSLKNALVVHKAFYQYDLLSSEYRYRDACFYYRLANSTRQDWWYENTKRVVMSLFWHTVFKGDPTCQSCADSLKGDILKAKQKGKLQINDWWGQIAAEYFLIDYIKTFNPDPEIRNMITVIKDSSIADDKYRFLNSGMQREEGNKKYEEYWYRYLSECYWKKGIDSNNASDDFTFHKDKLFSTLKAELNLFAESNGVENNPEITTPMLFEYGVYYLLYQYIYRSKEFDKRKGVFIAKELEKMADRDVNSPVYMYLEKNILRTLKEKFQPIDTIIAKPQNIALFFASDQYQDKTKWPTLRNPIKDAHAIAVELKQRFGFDTTVVRNTTWKDIDKTLRESSRKTYRPQDQLFLFFAGHGFAYDQQGFLVTQNSMGEEINTYYSYPFLHDLLEKHPCQHIFIVIDACYSGRFFPTFTIRKSSTGIDISTEAEAMSDAALQRQLADLMQGKTRIALTSSGDEPVSDGYFHSPFAERFLNLLKGAKRGQILTTSRIKTAVENQQAPNPKIGRFGTGIDTSEFVFVCK